MQVFGPSPVDDQSTDIESKKGEKETEVAESETETEIAHCSPAADVFVWENPLHSLQRHNPATPDEQADLEYDGEIIEDQNGVKSYTPIKFFKRTTTNKYAVEN